MSGHPWSRPNLEFYRKQAKSLLKLVRRRDERALARIRTHHPRFRDASNETLWQTKLALSDVQLVIAREIGMRSWSELKQHVNAAARIAPLVRQWSEALNDRDFVTIEALLAQHPQLCYTEFYPRRKLPHYHSATYGPLLWAVWIEDFDIVRLLLQRQADPNHESQSCLPLLVASPEMSDLLIAHGADVNRYCVNGGTPLMFGIGDLRRVRYLIANGADVNLAKPNSGETPLMLRMDDENSDDAVAVAELLLQSGADVNARTRTGLEDEPIVNHGNDQNISQGGMTALHRAVECGNVRLVECLLRYGADCQSRTVSRRSVYFGHENHPFPFEPFAGEMAVDWAIRGGNEQIIRLLDPNRLDDLYWAAASGVESQVEKLLQEGADVNQRNNQVGKLPLDAALLHKRRNVCRILLANGAPWTGDVRDAIELGIPEVVQEALRSDTSFKEQLLASPRTLLHWAQRGGAEQREILEAIGRTSPQPEADLILAIGLRDTGWVRTLLPQYPNAFASLIKMVPEITCYCVWEPDVLQTALDAGADIDLRDELLQATPLHWAIKLNQPKSVHRLLTCGADANALLTIGDGAATPLVLIAQQRSDCTLEVVEPLLWHGAEPNWQMHNGYTALDILLQRWGRRPESEYEKAVRIVRQYGGKTASELGQIESI